MADLDESSPLSAPDLRRLTDRLHNRSLLIRDGVLRHALSHRRRFSHLLSLCSAASSRSAALSSDLHRALDLLSPDAPDAQVRALAIEIAAAARQLEEKREALAAVEAIAAMVERLGAVREDVKAGKIVRAAEGVRVLREGIGCAGSEGKEPKVFDVLREETTRCFDELQDLLAGLVVKAVCFDADSRSLTITQRISVDETQVLELRQVLEALETVGVLEYGFAKVTDLIVKYAMFPIISENVDIYIEEGSAKDSDIGCCLKLVQPDESQEKEKGVSIYSRLIVVIKYIKTFLCYENNIWIHYFGRLTWSRVSELIITHFLSKAVPDDASKIAEFEDIIKHTVEFEEFLSDTGFISEAVEERLSLFVHNVEVHFATRKRNEILSKARHIILQCDFVSCPEDYVDLLFQPKKCIISKAAIQLMELVKHTLEDVCLSPAKVASEFYHAARDALLLYEAIVPVKLEKQLATTGQSAIIIYNDFLYLSQEVAGLAFEYRPYFPNGVKEVAVFLDLALFFRKFSDDLLCKQVQLVSSNLKEALDGANGFQNTHQVQQFDLAKFAIDQVIFILEKVHIIWEPLLPKSIYKKSMCGLLDSVFLNMTNDILLLDDLAADETLQLQRLILLTKENLASLVEPLHNEAYEKDLLPSLSKFCKLADLLDMPLRSITTAWENGELVTCGFTLSEIVNFIKATFTDSPLRKECLWRIESTST